MGLPDLRRAWVVVALRALHIHPERHRSDRLRHLLVVVVLLVKKPRRAAFAAIACAGENDVAHELVPRTVFAEHRLEIGMPTIVRPALGFALIHTTQQQHVEHLPHVGRELRVSQQRVDQCLTLAKPIVGKECRAFGGRRDAPDQVEIHPAQKHTVIGTLGRADALFLPSDLHEIIDHPRGGQAGRRQLERFRF